jgi:hypothetical protein
VIACASAAKTVQKVTASVVVKQSIKARTKVGLEAVPIIGPHGGSSKILFDLALICWQVLRLRRVLVLTIDALLVAHDIKVAVSYS